MAAGVFSVQCKTVARGWRRAADSTEMTKLQTLLGSQAIVEELPCLQ